MCEEASTDIINCSGGRKKKHATMERSLGSSLNYGRFFRGERGREFLTISYKERRGSEVASCVNIFNLLFDMKHLKKKLYTTEKMLCRKYYISEGKGGI